MVELAESLPDGVERNEVEDVRNALGRIEGESDPSKIKKSSAMSKFGRFIEKVTDTEKALGKAIQGVKDGIEIGQRLVTAFNDIAAWCQLPPFLG